MTLISIVGKMKCWLVAFQLSNGRIGRNTYIEEDPHDESLILGSGGEI